MYLLRFFIALLQREKDEKKRVSTKEKWIRKHKTVKVELKKQMKWKNHSKKNSQNKTKYFKRSCEWRILTLLFILPYSRGFRFKISHKKAVKRLNGSVHHLYAENFHVKLMFTYKFCRTRTKSNVLNFYSTANIDQNE